MKFIKNAKIITPTEILENKAVAYNNTILDIVDMKNIPEDAEIIDGRGCYLSPGFIDIHVHGCMGYDTMDEDENAVTEISKGLLETGVTAFLPTTMTMDFSRIYNSLFRIKEAMKNNVYAQILGCHLEGPFLNKKYKGAQDGKYMMSPDFNKISSYKDIIKTVTVAPELDGSMEFIKECRRNNIVVSIGHTNATFDEVSAAVKAGASHVTHTFNAMTPLHHRNPGVVGAAMYFDVTCEMITDNIHLHPAVQKILYNIKGNDRVILVTDAMRACLLKDGEYDLGGQMVNVNGKEARLSDGTIAGSVHTMNNAVKNFIENTGATLSQTVNMASLNPARLLGIENRKGSIEKNKDADFVLLDDNFNVKKTFVNGRMVYSVK